MSAKPSLLFFMAPISTTPTTERIKVEYRILKSSWAEAPLVISITERLPSVGSKLGHRLIRWNRESEENNIVVNGHPLKVFNFNTVPLDVNLKLRLEKALYIDPDWDRLRSQLEQLVRLVRSRIAKVQIGVWYKPSNSRGQRRTFSVEYERDFLSNSAAYICLDYGQKLIHIDVSATLHPQLQIHLTSPHTQIWKRETGEINYNILVKFSSICKLGLGSDESGQACEYPWHHHQRSA
jgi:hypothetical protein